MPPPYFICLFTATLMLSFGSAHATSSGRSVRKNTGVCETEARFIEALPKSGKVVWIFERIQDSKSKPCAPLKEKFEVWIWSGSYSTLSKSLVYPVFITEPKAGDSLHLRLEHRKKPIEGWFITE